MNYQVLRRLDGGMQMMEWEFAAVVAVALALFVWRVCRRQATRGDYLIVACAFLTSAAIWIMNIVSLGEVVTFWRYHYSAFALLFGYCGYVVTAACRRVPRLRCALAALLAVGFAVSVLRPLRHGGHPEKYAAESVYYAHCRAAELIRKDWPGPARSPRPFGIHEYLSPRRPLVAAYDRVAGYRCGGRSIELVEPCQGNDLPDYWLISDHEDEVLLHWLETCPEVRKSLVAEIDTGRERFSLYRTERTDNDGAVKQP